MMIDWMISRVLDKIFSLFKDLNLQAFRHAMDLNI